MARNQPAKSSPSKSPTKSSSKEQSASWREHAVSRSLDSARSRAEKRVERFLDAALELMNNDSGKDFTVQDVVERSGQSLRSFYQYFAGKHELLLALFEEAVRSSAERLREVAAESDDPLERLHRVAIEHYLICRPVPKGRQKRLAPTPAMSQFGQQLLTDHPKEAARAFGPVVSLFEELLDEAAAAGAIRSGLHHRHLAGVMLQAIMFNAFAATISSSSLKPDGHDAAEELWDFLFNGIAPN